MGNTGRDAALSQVVLYACILNHKAHCFRRQAIMGDFIDGQFHAITHRCYNITPFIFPQSGAGVNRRMDGCNVEVGGMPQYVSAERSV